MARPSPALLAAFLVAVAACLAGYALRWRMVLGALGLVSPLGAVSQATLARVEERVRILLEM